MPHRGATDSTHKVTLSSAIQVARWTVPSAAAGETAPLEIRTHFVGDGSDVKIEVRTKSGKTLGRTQAKVGRNVCALGFSVPEKTAEDIFFEAQLPDHGLKARSNLLKVLPPRSVSNARWDRKEARRGDIVKLQVDTRGIPDGTEIPLSIYEHDADGAHDLICELKAPVKASKIELEWEYQYHEDTDEIPTHEESEKGYNPPEYFFVARCRGTEAKSGLLEFKDWFEVKLVDGAGRPLSGMEFTLEMPDGSKKEGTLDKDGVLRLQDAPPGKAKISFPKGLKGIGKATR